MCFFSREGTSVCADSGRYQEVGPNRARTAQYRTEVLKTPETGAVLDKIVPLLGKMPRGSSKTFSRLVLGIMRMLH